MRLTFNIIKILILLFCFVQAHAEEIIIKDIRVEGLERIKPGTVFNYLPIGVGDSFEDSHSTEVIHSLFKTGFFDDISLEREGDVLIFTFKERPTIGSILFFGNEDINTEELLESLKHVGFAEGRVFVRSQLDQVEQELQRQYFSFGKYAATVDTELTKLGDNRVGIKIDISEGVAAKIKNINIVGNKAFLEEDILKTFSLTTPNLFSFFSDSDRYSKQKLAGDLGSLNSYYLDRGYLNFNIDSTQVAITPDKKDIYITINVTEGEQYYISEVKLAGQFIVPDEELFELIVINKGDVFSRKKITGVSKAISDRLGEEGYSFSNVNSIPEINKKDKTVGITFFIDPGKRVYVRRIKFRGNSKTKDEVLRREMRQQESAWASTKKIERGKVRLQRTGYFQNINVDLPAVVDSSDQVDVLYTVEETPSGRLGAGLGFSPGQGVIFNASIVQDNFFGSGKRLSFDFSNSSYNTRYAVGYLNPYFTVNGVSQGYEVFYRNTEAANANLASYLTREIGGSTSFGIPISENNSFFTELEYKYLKIGATDNSSREIVDFINENGDRYDILIARFSFSHDTTNKFVLPDKGALHRISAEISIPGLNKGLEFYKLRYKVKWFKDIYKSFILSLFGEIAYGGGYDDSSQLPFFENFFGGGIKSVRGFEQNTLGPRDSRNLPLGGDKKVITSAELILPVPFLSDYKKSVRIVAFVDGGYVYGSDEDISIDDFRYSSGIGMIWVSPLGIISMNYAFPLNEESGDRIENFQFTFGTSF